MMDSCPVGVHHRPGAHRAARHRRLPGGRHDRHHDADRQAQLHDPAPAGDPARDPRGLPHRPHRAPGAGARRHPGRPLASGDRLRAGHRRHACPATSRPPRATPSRSARPPRRWPPRGGRCSTSAAAWSTPAPPRSSPSSRRRPLPGHLHPDGPRRLPGAARAVAGHARHARHAHGQLRDGRGRPDLRVGARFDDRITGKLAEFAPRAKFIHIDIDPAEISKNVPAHIPIVGDARNILGKLVVEYRALGRRHGAPRRRGGRASANGASAHRCATTTARAPRSSPSA